MTDRPIIFSSPMVCALLDGRKTMTRRLAWRNREPNYLPCPTPWQSVEAGERLWVKETFFISKTGLQYAADLPEQEQREHRRVRTITTDLEIVERWTSPIHMSRRLSRITLAVTATKIEPLQKISNAESIAEGCSNLLQFAELWRSLHDDDLWSLNPEVVAITFEVHKRNIDA